MKTEKVFTLIVSKSIGRGNRPDPPPREVTGTLEELKKYFSYTLEVGNSWDKKVNMNPKNITSFVNNLQRAYEAKEAQCYDRTSVELKES